MAGLIDFSSPVPLILRKRAATWNNEMFLGELLSGDLRSVETQWRICPLTTKRTYREFESVFITATFKDFDEWYKADPKVGMKKGSSNPFLKIPPRCDKVVAVYADYKHFNELFSERHLPDYGNFIELFGDLPNQEVGGHRKCPKEYEQYKVDEKKKESTRSDTSKSVWNERSKADEDENLKTPVCCWGGCEPDPNPGGANESECEELKSLFSSEHLTLWLSTHTAHTPLHYDSYGCNVVTQVMGRKRWRLWSPSTSYSTSVSTSILASTFCPSNSSPSSPSSSFSSDHPPSDPTTFAASSTISSSQSPTVPFSSTPQATTTSLGASLPPPSNSTLDIIHKKLPCLRIPYEESSVYSTFDPRLKTSENQNHIPNYDFILEEGDILFVPKHFWHFVETLSELSLSVNLWLPVPLPPQQSYSPSNLFEKKNKMTCNNEDGNEKRVTMNKNYRADEQYLKTESTSKIKRSGISNTNKSSHNSTKSKEFKNKINDENTEIYKHSDKNGNENAVSDAHSRLVEAAVRVVFGSLKGTVSRIFNTDDVRAGWLNPSEIGGTLDFSRLSSDSRDEKEVRPKCSIPCDGDIVKKNEECEGEGDECDDSENEGESADSDAQHRRHNQEDKSSELHLELLFTALKNERKELLKSSRRIKGGEEVECSGIDDMDFEGFLKRFINAILQPEVIGKCLKDSL